MEEKACLLCHSIVTTYVPLEMTIIRKLCLTFPDLSLKLLLNETVICEACHLKLENYSKALTEWSRMEHRIINSEGKICNINLEETYLKNLCEGENTLKICRLCVIPTSSFVALIKEKAKMWEKCLSALNLNLSINPVLCTECDETLTAYYQFTILCTTKREKLKTYVQEHQLSNVNILNVINHMNNNSGLSSLCIENVMTVDETETGSRYNTRKRKIVFEDDADDEDIFNDNDDEDGDPDFIMSDEDTSLGSYNPGSRRRVSNRMYYASKERCILPCKYCNAEFESNLMQLHHQQCEKIPFKRVGRSWTCVYCSLEGIDGHRLEEHLSSCDNYQMTLQRKELECQEETLLESTSESEDDEDVQPASGTVQTSHQDDANNQLKLTLHTSLANGEEERLKVTISWNNNSSDNRLQIQGSEALPSSRNETLNLTRISAKLSTNDQDVVPTLESFSINNNDISIGQDSLTSAETLNMNNNDTSTSQDSLHTVETSSINNNNSTISNENIREDSNINAGTTRINILSNVLLPPVIGPKKTIKKFTESSQCLILQKCVNCTFNTRCNDKMLKHVIEHMGSECPECHKSIEEKSSMHKHLIKRHQRDFATWYYWCVSCAELFRARRAVDAHKCESTKRRVVFRSNGTVFCMLCKFESNDVRESQKHQLVCLRDLNTKGIDFEPEVIELD